MSLYNILFGQNQFSQILLAMLGITQSQCGRFRDCYPSDDGTKIIVYTRNGGSNREAYQDCIDALARHPCYVRDYDDDYDCTYASIEFSVPPQFAEAMKQIADQSDTRSPGDKWQKLIGDLQNGTDSAAAARALEVGKKLFGAIESGKSQTVSTPEGSINVISSEDQP